MKKINELKDYNNLSKIDSMPEKEIKEWYLVIKNSLTNLSRHYTPMEIDTIKSAIFEYERRHGLL